MQKLTLMLAAVLCCHFAAQAQKGVEIGLSFTPMTTWIVNDEDFAEGADLNLRGTFGYVTGLTAGYNITEGFGIQTGFLFNKCGQNYATNYDSVAKADQNVFSRRLSYFRLPVLFKVSGAADQPGGMYFRIGPHFDFLNSARYVYEDKVYSGLLDGDLNLKDFSKSKDEGLYGLVIDDTDKFYKSLVVGATLELGGQVRINDNMKLVFMLHLEGSLTNPEDIGGGDTGLFPASNLGERGTAWQLAGGLTIGYHYVIPVGNE